MLSLRGPLKEGAQCPLLTPRSTRRMERSDEHPAFRPRTASASPVETFLRLPSSTDLGQAGSPARGGGMPEGEGAKGGAEGAPPMPSAAPASGRSAAAAPPDPLLPCPKMRLLLSPLSTEHTQAVARPAHLAAHRAQPSRRLPGHSCASGSATSGQRRGLPPASAPRPQQPPARWR